MEAHINDLWMVFVTSNFRRNPTDPESMRTRDFVEVISSEFQKMTMRGVKSPAGSKAGPSSASEIQTMLCVCEKLADMRE